MQYPKSLPKTCCELRCLRRASLKGAGSDVPFGRPARNPRNHFPPRPPFGAAYQKPQGGLSEISKVFPSPLPLEWKKLKYVRIFPENKNNAAVNTPGSDEDFRVWDLWQKSGFGPIWTRACLFLISGMTALQRSGWAVLIQLSWSCGEADAWRRRKEVLDKTKTKQVVVGVVPHEHVQNMMNIPFTNIQTIFSRCQSELL